MRNADRPPTLFAALRYLVRLDGLHLGAVLIYVGFLVAVAGVPAAGASAIAAGGALDRVGRLGQRRGSEDARAG